MNASMTLPRELFATYFTQPHQRAPAPPTAAESQMSVDAQIRHHRVDVYLPLTAHTCMRVVSPVLRT